MQKRCFLRGISFCRRSARVMLGTYYRHILRTSPEGNRQTTTGCVLYSSLWQDRASSIERTFCTSLRSIAIFDAPNIDFPASKIPIPIPIPNSKSIKLSVTRDSSDDGASSKHTRSLRHSLEDLFAEIDRNQDPEPSYPGPALPSSSTSTRPPPFFSLFPVQSNQSRLLVTEPSPIALPAFTEVVQLDSVIGISSAEAEVKAALSKDTKAESSTSKSQEESEPPPPYTEGSSPLDGFSFTMAAVGGPASIITQVQQGGPAPVNTLGGTYWNGYISSSLNSHYA